MIADDLHRLLLAHQDADHGVFPVLEELDLADAPLDPLFFATALVEERLGKSEQLRADLEINVFILLMRLHLHLVELHDRCKFRGTFLGLGVRGIVVLLVACVDIKSPMAVDGAGAAASSSSLIS